MIDAVETKYLPEELLDVLEKIEYDMGRIKGTGYYEDRVIDLDILLFDNISLLFFKLKSFINNFTNIL